jgi:hypothetical protein
MGKTNKFVKCYECKNAWDCERNYLGGCTDGEEWNEEKESNDEQG